MQMSAISAASPASVGGGGGSVLRGTKPKLPADLRPDRELIQRAIFAHKKKNEGEEGDKGNSGDDVTFTVKI